MRGFSYSIKLDYSVRIRDPICYWQRLSMQEAMISIRMEFAHIQCAATVFVPCARMHADPGQAEIFCEYLGLLTKMTVETQRLLSYG